LKPDPHVSDESTEWRARLLGWARADGTSLEPDAADSLIEYALRVLDWSRTRARLVGRDDLEWLLKEQIVPSFLALRLCPDGCDSVADIGAGAGIVGLACAIARPVLRAALIESVRRKYLFLHEAVRWLDPSSERLSAIWARAERVGREAPLTGSFSLVTARGVGGPETVLAMAAPFLKPGGRAVIFRSAGRGSGSGEPRGSEGFRLVESVASRVADVHADAWELSERDAG